VVAEDGGVGEGDGATDGVQPAPLPAA